MILKTLKKTLVFLILIAMGFLSLSQLSEASAFGLEKEAPGVKGGVIVAFGDSLTAGLGVPEEMAYPALLEKKLKEKGYRFKVINSGLSGETTAGGLRRASWVLRMKPDIVILELGANDGLRGLNLREMKKNLAQIIEKLKRRGVIVILAGMKVPPNYGRRYSERFEAVYSELAAQYQLSFIPFFLEGVAARPQLNQRDGLHPTAAGYEVVTGKIWPVIQKVIQERSK